MVRCVAAMVVLALLAHPDLALAVDGVIEINQAAALAGGVTKTDTAGFPVTLDAPGSYRLTSNLDLRGLLTSVSAINVLSDQVTIEFGGFSILGPTVCAGTPPSTALTCAPTGQGRGVDGQGREHLAISGGAINGMWGRGVICGDGCRVERMHFENCGDQAVQTSFSGMVVENVLRRNLAGIRSLGSTIIRGNAVTQSGASGIDGGAGDVVEGNSLASNRGTGIITSGRMLVRGNSVDGNGANGILATGSGNLIVDNTLASNTGFGIEFRPTTSGHGYGGNVLFGNAAGTVDGATLATQIGTNVCNGDTICP